MKIQQNRIGILLALAIAIAASDAWAQNPVSSSTQPPTTAAKSKSAENVGGESDAVFPVSTLRLTAALGGVIAMLGGLWMVFTRLKEKQQGFGPNALKALGLVLFLPTLLIIAVAVPQFNTQTLAALLGTVAGYVLSHSKPED
jgi:hypothetical protein